MIPKDFIKAIEAYYGEYERPLIRKTVLKYAEQFSKEELQQIYHNLILEFSGQYRVTPDIAAIEKIRRGLRENEGSDVYRHGRRIGYLDGGRFIPDLSILSSAAFKKYAYEYAFYDNPQGFLQLLEEDGNRKLVVTNQGVARK